MEKQLTNHITCNLQPKPLCKVIVAGFRFPKGSRYAPGICFGLEGVPISVFLGLGMPYIRTWRLGVSGLELRS